MQIIESIKKEAERIEEDALHSAKGHLNASQMWKFVHYILGIPMIISSVIAGAESLNNKPTWAAISAVVAATLGSVQTFINAEQKSSIHGCSGNNYLALKNNTRIFREIDVYQVEEKQAIVKLKSLSDERNSLNKSSPTIPRCTYWIAKKDIDKGKAQYQADQRNHK